jgi:hypothetical protein
MPEALKRVGRYDLIEVIGRGGAAVVYLARQRDLQRNVALKELAPYLSSDTSFAERFVDESRLTGSMNHANVVTIHEFFEDGGVPYIAMEYLPHGSLRQYIGKLTMGQIAGVLEGVLAGLSHGESHGIVHRDLKPENLLVAGDGRVKIADFGVARAYNKAVTRAVVTLAGTTIGTPAYMSPEQALGNELTAATDLYSLGLVGWEMLTGQIPFDESDTPVAVLYRQVHEPIPSVRTIAPEVDPALASWLERMLEKRPADRFQTADEAWERLEDIVLELLGPRWRREAPLAVAGSRPQRTLKPAAFGGGGAAVLTPPPSAVPETIDDLPATPAETVAPSARRRSFTTQHRLARRHRETEDAAPETVNARRRRLVVGGIVAAMIAAAVLGVALGDRSTGHHGPSAAQIRARERQAQARAAAAVTAVEQADRDLATIAQQTAVHRQPPLSALVNARSPSAQAAAARAVATVYAGAARRTAPLATKTTVAVPLTATMRLVAADYDRLAVAVRSKSKAQLNRARGAVQDGERKLERLVVTL